MTVEVDEDEVADGLLSVVVTLVEIIEEVLEKESVRRMETGNLTDEEIERLGTSLHELSEAVEDIKDDHEISDSVEDLRDQLDEVVKNEVIEVCD